MGQTYKPDLPNFFKQTKNIAKKIVYIFKAAKNINFKKPFSVSILFAL